LNKVKTVSDTLYVECVEHGNENIYSIDLNNFSGQL